MGTYHLGDSRTALGYELAQRTQQLLWRKGALKVQLIRAGDLEPTPGGPAYRGERPVAEPEKNLRELSEADAKRVADIDSRIQALHDERAMLVVSAWLSARPLEAPEIDAMAMATVEAIKAAGSAAA